MCDAGDADGSGEEALRLQRPLADSALRLVTLGRKKGGGFLL